MVLVSYKPMNAIVLAGLIVMVMHFLHAGRTCATLPGTEESMTTTIDCIPAFFCQIDDHLSGLPTHPEARLWPSEVVTLGLVHARKGVGNRACSRWLTRDYRTLFPPAPRADAALSPLQDASGLDAGLPGRADGARRPRHLWDRLDPSDARRPQSPADWPQRPLESPLECRRETVSPSESVGVGRRVGMCHRACRGYPLSVA